MRVEITLFSECNSCQYIYAPKRPDRRVCPECGSTDVKDVAYPNCAFYEDGQDRTKHRRNCPGVDGDYHQCPVLDENGDKSRRLRNYLKNEIT